MNIITEKQNIKALIATGRMKEAMPTAMDFVKSYGSDDDVNTVVLNCCNYSLLERKERNNEIDINIAMVQRNTIIVGLLRLLDNVEDDFSMLQKMRA
jgi:uncharacterized membrane protein